MKPIPYAQILITRHTILRDRYYNTYEWEGKRNWPVMFHESSFADERPLLPWPLKKIRDNPWLGESVYIRTDTWTWPFTYVRHRASDWAHWWTVRLVMTLMIWGMAYVAEGERITWAAVGRLTPSEGGGYPMLWRDRLILLLFLLAGLVWVALVHTVEPVGAFVRWWYGG